MTLVARIVDLFTRHPHTVMAPAEVHAVLGGAIASVQTTLKRLRAQGVLAHDGYGRYRCAHAPTCVLCSCHTCARPTARPGQRATTPRR